jgi:chromosome segregation ATPase
LVFILQYQVAKGISPEAKQAKAVEWFRQSLAAHSFKDLEKALPQAASVNKMQIKEFVQALTDEGHVRVEKIGGGNWYWSFVSDAKKQKEKVLYDLTTEETKLNTSIAEIDAQIEEEMAAREEDDEMLEDNGMDRKALLEAHETLLKESAALIKELAGYSDNDPSEIERKAAETKRMKESAEKWTDYIEGVEGLLRTLTGDKAAAIQFMENICGEEYVPGEGLKEL